MYGYGLPEGNLFDFIYELLDFLFILFYFFNMLRALNLREMLWILQIQVRQVDFCIGSKQAIRTERPEPCFFSLAVDIPCLGR